MGMPCKSPVDDRNGRRMIFVNATFPQGANGQNCSESRGQEATPEPSTYWVVSNRWANCYCSDHWTEWLCRVSGQVCRFSSSFLFLKSMPLPGDKGSSLRGSFPQSESRLSPSSTETEARGCGPGRQPPHPGPLLPHPSFLMGFPSIPGLVCTRKMTAGHSLRLSWVSFFLYLKFEKL